MAESCSRQLRAWADHLQNSDIKGQRHLTERAKHNYKKEKDAEAFRRELLEALPPNHPQRKQKLKSKNTGEKE